MRNTKNAQYVNLSNAVLSRKAKRRWAFELFGAFTDYINWF